MTIYNYVALQNGKDVVKGKVEAHDLREARENIRKLGFIPTKVYEEKSKADEIKENLTKVPKGKVSNLSLQEKIDFTSTLQILAQSGIPIIESLMFIETDAAKLKVRLVARELRRQIMQGATFADTVAKYPDQFGQVYIGLVKAGEDSGELEKTLMRLLELLTKQANIKSKVIGTLMYPAFVIVLACVIMLVMLLFVFPAFKEMFAQQEKQLPLITSIMINAGDYLKTYWYTIPIFIVAFIVFCYIVVNWKPARELLDKFILKIPLLNNMIMYSNYSNFMSVLSVSYEAGIPIVDCLFLANLTIDIKEEQCLLLCLIITKYHFCKNTKEFLDEILNVINKSEDKNITKIMKADFGTECQEINNKIEYNSIFIIKNQLSECFKDSLLNSSINKFLQNYYLINDLIEPIISDEKNKGILWEYQNNYIRNWTKNKLNQFSESYYKSWDPLQEVPYETQLLLNFYFDFDINANAMIENNFQKTLENFEKIKNDFCKIDEDEETPKYSSFGVRPIDAFAWGLSVKHYTNYKWPLEINDTILTNKDTIYKQQIIDSVLLSGVQCVWVVNNKSEIIISFP